MHFPRSALIAAALLVLFGGCRSILPQSDQEEALILSGENRVGETCTVERFFQAEYSRFATRQFQVLCGSWEHPSGYVFEVHPARHSDSLEAWTRSGGWIEHLGEISTCESPGKEVILDQVDALVLDCKLRNGDWSYNGLITELEGSIYLADGIPAVFSLLEQTTGVVSGHLNPASVDETNIRSIAMTNIEKRLSSGFYGAGDIKQYYRLMATGQFYNNIKDFTTAAERYREALSLQEKILGANNPGVLDALMHLALGRSNQGRFAEADLLFERAAPLADTAVDQGDLARFKSYLALHAANQQDFQAAYQLAHEATRLREQLVAKHVENLHSPFDVGPVKGAERPNLQVIGQLNEPARVDIVQSLYIEAAMLERLGNFEAAERALGKARRILESAEERPPSWRPEILGLVAGIAESRGSVAESSQYLEKAVSLWEEIAPGERPSVIYHLKLGNSYKEQGLPEQAMKSFERAIALVQIRNGTLSFDQLQPYFQTGLELAEKYPERSAAIHTSLFEAGQLVRTEMTSRTIAQAVTRLAAGKGRAAELIRDFQEAQDERNLLFRSYEAELAKSETEARRKRVAELERQLAEINRHIADLSLLVQSALPRYNQLVDTVADAATVGALLKEDEVLVQVLLGLHEGLLFVVRRNRIKAVPLDLSFMESAEIVAELRNGLKPEAGSLATFDVALAHKLYLRLFGAVKEDIGAAHLITVPSGALLSLPFGLLVTEKAEPVSGYDYRHVSWLAKHASISLLPSVQSFVGLRGIAKASEAEQDYIGFADFETFEPETLEKVHFKLPTACQSEPERLNFHRRQMLAMGALEITRSEVSEIASLFPANSSDRVFREQFTDVEIKRLPLNDYRILYFATHGLLPYDLECQSVPALVTTLADNGDGLLDMDEILDLRLDADLVVLSACNSGGPGSKNGGESLSGLARAFFFAGARTLIVSHWLAENNATVQLMVTLFRYGGGSGQGLADALRHAQMSLMDLAEDPDFRAYSHPLIWGAFTVVGDGARKVTRI